MADEPQDTPTDGKPQDTPDAQGPNAGGTKSGAATPPADKPEAEDKKFTQADVDRIVKDRLQRDVKKELQKELKKLSGEQEGQPSVEELKGRAESAETELRRYRARDQVDAYVSDKRNNLTVRNVRALMRLVEHDFEYDDEGEVTNLKELVAQAKAEAPELFGTAAGSADGGAGAQNGSGALDMNSHIRQMAGRQ